MPAVSEITRWRAARRGRARRSLLPHSGGGCSLAITLIVILAGLGLVLSYTVLSQGLPSPETLPALLQPPGGLLLQPTRLYDRNGEHLLYSLQNPGAVGRQYLPLSLFPTSLISATLATQDPAFWQHPGFTLLGSRATLAQQLVSELLFPDEQAGLRRSMRERLLAAQVTSQFGREKILEWYLNSANYGRLAYGADAAARVYFNKPALNLTLAEAALLAGVAETPALNPLDSPQSALDRQGQVLEVMEKGGWISTTAAKQARTQAMAFRPAVTDNTNLAPAFTRLALAQLETQIPRPRLERGGLTVITTLDLSLQTQVDCALTLQLDRQRAPQPAALEIPAGCQAGRLLPTLPGKEPLPTLEGAAVILDPRSGQVLALSNSSPLENRGAQLKPPAPPNLVSDADLFASPSTPSLALHPAGSLLTPLIYLTAFTQGLGPASLVWDVSPYPEGDQVQEVGNFDGRYHGPLRLRSALANDYQVPALRLLAQVGSESVVRTARQLGLTQVGEGLSAEAGLPWEDQAFTLLESSHFFGVFANGGTLAGRTLNNPQDGPLQPIALQQVQDPTGRIWLDWHAAQTRPVLTPQLAYLVTNVLSDETARWPSLGHPNALEIGRPAAAKLGRTISGNDVWTVGYTPQRLVGVWMGQEPPTASATAPLTTTRPLSASLAVPLSPNLAAGLWHAILQYASRDLPSQDWPLPPGISTVQVCDPSGLLPTPQCPSVVGEIFLSGNEPNQVDTLYRTVNINRETGRLATIFTPPELLEEQVFLSVPPEAASWAREAGLATPPEEYDVFTHSGGSLDAQITSPAAFAAVRGQVEIRGQAGGENFSFYRIQVGQGLDPQAWFQVGQDITTTVPSGPLVTWDAHLLEGLYTLQLLVVDQDQQLHTDSLLVTVDNQPPQVEVQHPASGQILTGRGAITLQASAEDNLAMQEVAFYIDGQLFRSLSAPPYAWPWSTRPGQHTLRVVATDRAGNTAETQIDFSIK